MSAHDEVVEVLSLEAPAAPDRVQPIRGCRGCGIGTFDEWCSTCRPLPQSAPAPPEEARSARTKGLRWGRDDA